ncbi:hypothetical protein [Glutamicibacter sp. FBE19]|uniref:hypothetical protein n=1 Tax=Glutamicibacter sp. FBE19 TaxID=2761534 RepID=UPI0018965D10|nr:hypothetical protein [Glutamicibacter sp. FBE19]MBF6671393.1 hypothetical protein [Glutamicibacter sp. FBE19]
MPVLQPPEPTVASRDFSGVVTMLAVTWQHPRSRVISPVGLLTHDVNGTFRFSYIQNAQDVQGFRPLVGFPSLDQAYESDHLFPLFAQRVMSPRRPDYLGYLKTLGLERNATPWEVLALSGGRRTGDTIQLVPVPVPLGNRTWEIDFLVHGVRHVIDRSFVLENGTVSSDRSQLETALEGLAAGDQLYLVPDADNGVNANAQLIVTDAGLPIGFLPDLFTEDFERLDRDDIRCEAVVVNNSASPWHMRVLARLMCKVPENFTFFSSASWDRIA